LHIEVLKVRFQVLTAASMKMYLFWVLAPCTFVEIGRRFRCAHCLDHQGDESPWWQKE